MMPVAESSKIISCRASFSPKDGERVPAFLRPDSALIEADYKQQLNESLHYLHVR